MINTEGPQKNLTFTDRLFLLMMMVTFAIVPMILFFGITSTLTFTGLIILYIFWGGKIKEWLQKRLKNIHHNELMNWSYIFIIVVSLVAGIIINFWDTTLSNKLVMLAVYLFGILILNGIVAVLT